MKINFFLYKKDHGSKNKIKNKLKVNKRAKNQN
jgi:hypothetical protein